jgi:Tol biopolymer transport system component
MRTDQRANHVPLWVGAIAIACVLVAAGCQEGSGPSLTSAPDVKPGPEGKKPQPPPPPPPADPAIAFDLDGEIRVMNADGTNETTIFVGGGRLSWSPDGTAIAFDGPDGHIWRIDVSVVGGVPTGTNARILVVEEDPNHSIIGHPAWSPNGDQIAYERYGLVLRIESVPADGGTPEILYTSESGGSVRFLTWNPDGTKIAFVEGSRPIRVLDVATGQATTVLSGEWSEQYGWPMNLEWARTQDVLAFDANEGGRIDIYTMELPNGTPIFLIGGPRRDRARMPTWSPDDQEIIFAQAKAGAGAVNKLRKIDLTTREVIDLGVDGLNPDWRRF